MVANEFSTMVEEALDDILRTLFHNKQSGIQSVVYYILKQVMLDLLHKDVIGKTMDPNIAYILDLVSDLERVYGAHCDFCKAHEE